MCRSMALMFFLAGWFISMAQDKVIRMDGSAAVGKVEEIRPDDIRLSGPNGQTIIARPDAILVEFSNGAIERFAVPEKGADYGSSAAASPTPGGSAMNNNIVSVNALALCNADATVFYERLFANRSWGAGLMGAYNFNRRAIVHNIFVALLYNGRKTHDLGVFVNFYPEGLRGKNRLYFGAMLKYMGFEYSKVREDTLSGGAVNVSYSPARGSQLSPLFTLGTHTTLEGKFFIRTLCGFGAFELDREYRSQLKLMTTRRNPEGPIIDADLLPKIYLGLHIGIVF